MKRTLFYIISQAVFIVLLGACSLRSPQPNPTAAVGETTAPVSPAAPTATPEPTPSATSAPLAALVNGEGITLAEFEAELGRYRLATGLEPTAEERQRVLDSLVDTLLLAQAAAENGFTVGEELLAERMNDLSQKLGGSSPAEGQAPDRGEAALAQWINDHGYSAESFREALRRSIAAAWMRDQIAGRVSETAEQVHARQILLYDSAEASDVLAQLQAGNDFGNLALQYDPFTGGELGWFPRGYLPDPDLEAAAFDLQPGQYSQVIQTAAGFHILQVTERDPLRPLDPEPLLILQGQAVERWLAERRQDSDIQVLVD